MQKNYASLKLAVLLLIFLPTFLGSSLFRTNPIGQNQSKATINCPKSAYGVVGNFAPLNWTLNDQTIRCESAWKCSLFSEHRWLGLCGCF